MNGSAHGFDVSRIWVGEPQRGRFAGARALALDRGARRRGPARRTTVGLESSALTNAFPVHRLGLAVGDAADAPAAYVRALDLAVERLEQRYARLPDDEAGRQRYRYSAPAFRFECELTYDESGVLLAYPGIAVRVA